MLEIAHLEPNHKICDFEVCSSASYQYVKTMLDRGNMNFSEELDKPSFAKTVTIIDPKASEPINLPKTMTIIDPWTKEPIKLPIISRKLLDEYASIFDLPR
ncbi:hypothetical protein ACTXT7_007067 [Hymenolepis weldensis]